MKLRTIWFLILVAACGLNAPLAAQQPAGRPAAPPLSEKFDSELSRLDPADPEKYFLLGERIAAEARDIADRDLAKRLFVLAFELSRRAGARSPLAASSCLAIAAMPGEERRADWLRSIASMLDDRFTAPEWLLQRAPDSQESAEYLVATLLGLVRSGDGALARQLITRPDVSAALARFDGVMKRLGVPGGESWVRREADRWPCRECGNQRIVRRIMVSPPEYRACPNCNGNPGPNLSARELLGQVKFESILLQGQTRSWGAQITLDGGEPLLDPDPALLPRIYLVDTAATLWRDGRWVRPEGSAESPAAPEPEQTESPAQEPNPPAAAAPD